MRNRKSLHFLLFVFCLLVPIIALKNSPCWTSNCNEKEQRLQNESKEIIKELRVFNSACDSIQARMAAEAIEAFEMSAQRDLMIAQLCTESSAKHNKGRSVLISSGGAMGISQTTPTTAFQFLKYGATIEDKKKLEKIGVSIPSWIEKMKYSTNKDGKRFLAQKDREKMKQFLSDPKNNISLWTCMMAKLEAKYGMEKALIAYTDGEGSIKKKNPKNHPYVLRVKKNKKFISNQIHADEHKRGKKNISKKRDKA